MSLATELTQCQARLVESGRMVSAEVRRIKGIVPPNVYDEIMLHLCAVAAEANRLKVCLEVLRMTGELEQMPPPVTTERLELAQCGRRDDIDVSETTRRAFAHQLEMIGDDTLSDEKWKGAA